MNRRHTWLALLGVGSGLLGSYILARVYRRAKASCPPFRRRVYTSGRELAQACSQFWRHPEDLRSLRYNERIAGPFAAKVMLAVASEDGVAYPVRQQARYAMAQGLSAEEVRSLGRGELAAATMDEAPALYFAQHYAEREGHPDEDMLQRLTTTYGPRMAHDLVTFLQLLTLTKVAGNTFDALLSRILGHPSPDTTLRGELSVLLVLALGIVPLIPVLAIRMARTPIGGEPAADLRS